MRNVCVCVILFCYCFLVSQKSKEHALNVLPSVKTGKRFRFEFHGNMGGIIFVSIFFVSAQTLKVVPTYVIFNLDRNMDFH